MSHISPTDMSATANMDLAELDERALSSRRIFVTLGVAGLLFWVATGALVFSLF